MNNLALQALVAAFGANKAIVDESSTRTAIAKSRQTEHHRDTLNTTDPAGPRPAG